MTILIVAFLGSFGLVLSAGLLLFYRDVIRERLSALVDERLGTSSSPLFALFHSRQRAVEQIVRPFQKVLPRGTQESSVVQKRLIRADFRKDSAINTFFGAKVVLPLSLALLVTDRKSTRLNSSHANIS